MSTPNCWINVFKSYSSEWRQIFFKPSPPRHMVNLRDFLRMHADYQSRFPRPTYNLIYVPTLPYPGRHHFLYLQRNWSQEMTALPKQSKLPSLSCFLWITEEITSLKHNVQRDDVISSGPQETLESLDHSSPHLRHFTRNLFIPLSPWFSFTKG